MSNPHSSDIPPVPSDETQTARALRLDSWAPLRVSGADAESFLQGQLSADLRALKPQRAQWASYNSPKGRMLAVMQVLRDGEVIELWLPRGLIEPVAKRLRMFVMRSKVLIETPQPRAVDPETDARDRRMLITAGIPVVYPETQDRWVAQMANLDLIGGIGFEKGCYTGQEVVARLHYLGNLKKRMFLVRGPGQPPAPGSAIRDSQGDGQSVGDIVDACADEGGGFIATAVLQLAASNSEWLRIDREADSVMSRPRAFAYPGTPDYAAR
ncbi:MAG: CAF17-like 4Fe-4S cluster assembly/insertion protein YgfZ [Panacagrimonas sp.]